MFNLLIGSIHISLVPFKLHYLKCRLVQIGTFNGNKIPLFLHVLFQYSLQLQSRKGLLAGLWQTPRVQAAVLSLAGHGHSTGTDTTLISTLPQTPGIAAS